MPGRAHGRGEYHEGHQLGQLLPVPIPKPHEGPLPPPVGARAGFERADLFALPLGVDAVLVDGQRAALVVRGGIGGAAAGAAMLLGHVELVLVLLLRLPTELDAVLPRSLGPLLSVGRSHDRASRGCLL